MYSRHLPHSWLLLLAVVCLLAVRPSIAQDILHSEIVVRRVTNGGVLSACSVEYTNMFRDHTYRGGASSGATGSLTWTVQPNAGLVMMLKIVGTDFDANLKPQGDLRIAQAFVSVGANAYHADKQFECERPTGYCGAYLQEKALEVLPPKQGNISIGFNRRPGGMDLSIPIILDDAKHQGLGQCFVQLLDQAKSAPGKR